MYNLVKTQSGLSVIYSNTNQKTTGQKKKNPGFGECLKNRFHTVCSYIPLFIGGIETIPLS
jgi:hypothetical protein